MIRHFTKHLLLAIGLAFSFTSIPVLAADAKAQIETPKLMLRISADGKTIVDESGKEVARFSQDVKVNPKMNVSDRLPGCMRCQPECVVYEGERCVKWIRSCTWDFDCK
ncbi:MAG: hypothetical protein HXY26_04275 [Hydrogenophilaceae bacterium]|nr:hypothetical protein [Hydrogenophilaceae bacterium]